MSDAPMDPRGADPIKIARAIEARDPEMCCLHVVLSDYNAEHDFVHPAIARAVEAGHEDCEALGLALLSMEQEQLEAFIDELAGRPIFGEEEPPA